MNVEFHEFRVCSRSLRRVACFYNRAGAILPGLVAAPKMHLGIGLSLKP